ncbi:hypothetical protein B6S44_25000 [Bosea sp. Tri-44]|uniref:hypothetical protein n=1 Tax=Bosea sp. Tri-44 TaxID=1972137 RepID=UPI00100F8830|nr:hypothetical protein [Bosea sp. Tri-44]RXT46103.1 hypothetical protein B6S44_25000 [Bosea sp. Tri-44]
MSLVGFNEHAAAALSREIGPLFHGELDGLLDPLTQDERRDVRDMLDLIARQLAIRSETGQGIRRRLDAVVVNLIAVADTLDGDCDLEPTLAGTPSPIALDECEECCEDEGAQCDDEGEPNDHGIADADGLAELRGVQHLYGGIVT